ncbi:VHS and GAT domain-containing protein [Aspergillus candidus]|uniref:GAT domain-containing protein n=1 Tax=Aspergillus candidus TaxID=41067 RepID=A0A2I2FD90_ASPCN|nr:hypothetical protein BDW47DRAFT_105045 [Aspergillus candidus]PLB38557.1 hypothetical protein BDW47DRAFT_105045 [Aspergillus candidus]
MKRIFTSMRRPSFVRESAPAYPEDAPEAVVLRELMAFCQSGNGPNIAHGTEFVHLPGVVESAESSPNAAKEAAHRIRKLLADPASSSPNVQYNAIMLMRILIENPGHTFSRNLDSKFVTTVRDLLRQGKDLYVKQFLSETLDTLETQRPWDEDLGLLLGMWRKEKASPKWRNNASSAPPPIPPRDPNVPVIHRSSPGLPPPEELASRVAEAKTSASLLTQFVQSTPPAEFLDNELIKEFSDRCRNASRAVQDYIHGSNPPPDEDTLATLIETNDELSVALSKYQRAMLQARKALGQSGSQSPASSNDASGASGASRPVPAPPAPPREVHSIPALQPVPASQGPATYEPPSHSPPASYRPASPGPTAHELDSPVSPHGQTAYGVVPAPVGTGATGAGPNRYEYRSEDFQVQNPFADSYATNAGPPGTAGNLPADGTAPAPGLWNSAHPPTQRTT